MISAIFNRRSIRKYSDTAVSQEITEDILQASNCLSSPCGVLITSDVR